MNCRIGSLLFLIGTAALLGAAPAFAHCDGMDGPVVKAAQKALETGEVSLVLIWVQEGDEPDIKAAFEKTRSVRKMGREAQELADLYFFETLVRVHRAGEGEPYTGLKPAGRDLGPAIPAADRALETGSADPLVALVTSAFHEGIHERFAHASALKKHGARDIAAGREFVKAYVTFIHYVEGVYEAAGSSAAHAHGAEAAHESMH